MAGICLDGKVLARHIEQELLQHVNKLREAAHGQVPTLATILVGNDPASATYVKMKGNACKRVGMTSLHIAMPEHTTTQELLDQIAALNNNPDVHGILLQHPVPTHINERRCFDAIQLDKDVDGVTCHGFGRMAMGESAYGSATPAGIMRLLDAYHIPILGKHAVVVGRSPILGKPLAMMLLNAHATVTVCHSRTRYLAEIVRRADIIVGAVGRPRFIQGDWIAEGAVVIDAGYHPGGVGDIELSAVVDKCTAYTPVPGGVGPMTIAMLLTQTLAAAEKLMLNPGG
ncbi:MAG TPA: bifunctional methylenetetrahydrofolate dehydrogenase/methenyltetrahydrofolate cyclohydrolase FolD [Candidatus Tectomicrobia bacterium]|jgi:methylenetetrahydrofolate dehydrogenase (NADP+)/methenyltetrahydrofolate cyclohydrolase